MTRWCFWQLLLTTCLIYSKIKTLVACAYILLSQQVAEASVVHWILLYMCDDVITSGDVWCKLWGTGASDWWRGAEMKDNS